ncbi:demethylmenaquinone methyltransferase [Cumulibacter manganitolerans]|uniref:demethylmenaquinone methyltransferase n=1 Tax=Cumulibacter manganitolerans TaxID=1884992 RepID=UPI001E5250E6|nr:demethylmenaquinone methyltransferase [Cumulibacter manganitolerans]
MQNEPTRASLDKEPHEVQAMFDGVAKRYDLMNTLMTGGLDRAWRSATRKALQLHPGERVLDLACGTGVSTVELSKSGAYAVGADLSFGMLAAGLRGSAVQRSGVPLIAGDALHLPFADAAFDAVTISFGLRNVVRTEEALREMARVVRPSGRLVVCEFSRPTWAPFGKAYYDGALRIIPLLARKASSNPDAYVYLAESIKAWPRQEALANLIDGAGWQGTRWRNLAGGIVALHHATKPPSTR